MDSTLNANALAVLNLLKASSNHPTAQEIYERVRQTRPRIGLATVYRILHQLTEQGLIKEIGRDAECVRYDAHIHRHDHAICTTCGALLDIALEIPLPEEVLQSAAQSVGISLGSHEIRIYGKCRICQRRENER